MNKGDKRRRRRRAAAGPLFFSNPSLLDGTNNQLVSANILSGQQSLSKGFPQAGAQSAAQAGECSGRGLHEKPGRGVGSSSYLLLQEWPGKQRRREPVLCPLGFVHDQPRQQGMCVDLSVCRIAPSAAEWYAARANCQTSWEC